MVDWVIRSKLAPSVSQRSLLARQILVDRLDKVLEARAALLHAPAGFGKTSLLAYWRSELAARGIPVAWVSLDDHDQDLFQFLTYLMEACKAGGLVANAELPAPPGGISASPPQAIVGAVITELSKCDGPHVLILDDFHRAENPHNCRVVNQLIAALPANVHIVISTREYPAALSLADLRAHDELIEVDQAALHFSEQEIHTYLDALVETSGPANWSTQLFDRTEGWPIALNTVRRWLAEGASLQETLEQISGRSSDLSDYFLEQVFDNLDATLQSFLLKTSILERVNGDLANLLCDTDAGWQTLEDLERRDLFVQGLDRERNWYRYHQLFSEFLRERLRRRYEGLSTELHRLASEWFWRQDCIAEAVQHAIASGQVNTVADLFEKLGGWRYALQGHVGVLERALSLLGDSRLDDYPRLWLGKIFLTVRRGEIDRAEVMFAALAGVLVSSDNRDMQLDGELQLVRCMLNVYADNDISDEEIQQVEQLSESLSHNDDLMHAARLNMLSAMYAQRGSFEASVAAGDKAIRRYRAMGSVWGETFIYFHEGYACMAQGRLRDAEALYGAGYEMSVEHFGADSDLTAIASAFLAEAAYEKNSAHEATRLVEVALPHIERFDAWLEVYISAYTTAMKLARAASQWELLAEIKSRAYSTAANRGLPRLRAIVELQALEFEGSGASGRAKTRRSAVTDLAIDDSIRQLTMRRLRISVAARAHYNAGRNEQAIILLERECRRCLEDRLIRTYVAFSVLLSVVFWADGQHDAAVAAFETALSHSLFEGIKRPFIDEGAGLTPVIQSLTQAPEKQRGNRLRDRFLAELMMETHRSDAPSETGPGDLSPREQEVLRYLVQGRSNREIGEAAQISINTVKFHVKNIFDKLEVTTRKDAVAASIRRVF